MLFFIIWQYIFSLFYNRGVIFTIIYRTSQYPPNMDTRNDWHSTMLASCQPMKLLLILLVLWSKPIICRRLARDIRSCALRLSSALPRFDFTRFHTGFSKSFLQNLQQSSKIYIILEVVSILIKSCIYKKCCCVYKQILTDLGGYFSHYICLTNIIG